MAVTGEDFGLFWNSDDGDRTYSADSFEMWLKKFFTSGVFEGDLQVLAGAGMTVKVKPGYCNTNGKVMFFQGETAVTLNPANSTYPRIDTIVIERNETDRAITIHKVTGTYSGDTPIPTDPVRDDTLGVYQLVLAQIYVAPGVSAINQADITDTRMNKGICGYITGTVEEIDFTQISAQFQNFFSNFKTNYIADFNSWSDQQRTAFNNWVTATEAEYNTWTSTQRQAYTAWITAQVADWEDWSDEQRTAFSVWMNTEKNDFNTWFSNLHYVLDGDVAGHLQNEIDELQDRSAGSILNLSTAETSLFNKTVTVTGSKTSKSGTFDATGKCTISGFTDIGNITIESSDGIATATETASIPYFGQYDYTVHFWGATIQISTTSPELYGQSITIRKGGSIIGSTTFNYSGVATYVAGENGTYTFSVTYDGDTYSATVEVTEETTYTTTLNLWTATVNLSTTSPELYGATVTITSNVTGTSTVNFSAQGTATVTIHKAGTYKFSVSYDGETYEETVAITAETAYSVALDVWQATVNITTTSSEFYGQSITITSPVLPSPVVKSFSSSGQATFKAGKPGTYTFSCSYGGETITESVQVTQETTYSVQLNLWTATVNLTTTSSELYGATITVTSSVLSTPTTVTFDNTGHATYKAHKSGSYTFTCTYDGADYDTTLNITSQTTYTGTINLWTATINITTTSTEFYNKVITITSSVLPTPVTTSFDSTGNAQYKAHTAGTYTFSVTYGGKAYTKDVAATAEGTYSITLNQERIMTVNIDLTNSDPTTWATYADDAVGMTAGSDEWDDFFGHYPCVLHDGEEIGKVKKTDYTKYEDGTNVPTELGYDVMVKYKRLGYKIAVSDNTLTVSVTDIDGLSGYSYKAHSYKGNRCRSIYTGAYKAYENGGKMYSSSGKTPSVTSRSDHRNAARARGDNYEQVNYYSRMFQLSLYTLKYKGNNSQVAVGRGLVDGPHKNTGGTNDKGMDWGSDSGADQCKLLGMEDFWGNYSECLDGFQANTGYADTEQIKLSDGNYNENGTGYTNTGVKVTSKNNYLSSVYGGDIGFFHGDVSGSATTFFCDKQVENFAHQMIKTGTYTSTGWQDNTNTLGDACGAYYLCMDYSSGSTAKTGARLMYFDTES